MRAVSDATKVNDGLIGTINGSAAADDVKAQVEKFDHKEISMRKT